jgi:hypothetical protein
MRLADQIRHHVRREIIEPARAQGAGTVRASAREIHDALGLENRYPAVCGALDSDIFLDLAGVTLVERAGPSQSSTAEWVFAVR